MYMSIQNSKHIFFLYFLSSCSQKVRQSESMSSIPDLVNGKSVSEERRLELLALARASRIQWVLETLSSSDNTSTEKNILSILTKTEPGQNIIPISDSIQSIFNYFTDIIADHEFINIESMIPIACYDEFEYENEKENEIPTSYDKDLDPYAIFIDKLRRPLAIDIVKQLQLYIIKCKSTPVLNTLSAHPQLSSSALQSFLASVTNQCRSNALWSSQTPAEFEITKECIEKFVHIKVYFLVFGSESEDDNHDSLLSRRIKSLDFLSPEHLDIKSLLHHSVHGMPRADTSGTNNKSSSSSSSSDGESSGPVHWSVLLQGPMCHLSDMEKRQCPNDKMACVKRWAAATMNLLNDLKSKAPQPKQRSGPGGGRSAPPGADEFLSMLILTLQRCNPTSLYTTQKYMQSYLSPTKLNSEYGYLLAQFVSATHFLEYADASSLTISPEEFQLALDASKLAAEKQIEDLQNQQHGQGRVSRGGTRSSTDNDKDGCVCSVQWLGDGDIVLTAEDVNEIETQNASQYSATTGICSHASDLWKRYKEQQ